MSGGFMPDTPAACKMGGCRCPRCYAAGCRAALAMFMARLTEVEPGEGVGAEPLDAWQLTLALNLLAQGLVDLGRYCGGDMPEMIRQYLVRTCEAAEDGT